MLNLFIAAPSQFAIIALPLRGIYLFDNLYREPVLFLRDWISLVDLEWFVARGWTGV